MQIKCYTSYELPLAITDKYVSVSCPKRDIPDFINVAEKTA